MRRFENILFVPIGFAHGPPPAMDRAVELAEANGARLTVFAVVPTAPRLQRLFRLGDTEKSVTELAVAERMATLQEWADHYESTVPISVEVEVGRRPAEVVRSVQESGHDLVVLWSDGSDDSRAVVRRVLRACPCPVWVLRPPVGAGRVLAAIDPDDDPELNRLILELARSQAEQHGDELHVVHAWQPYSDAMFLGSEFAPLGGPLVTKFAAEIEKAHDQAFTDVLDSAGIGRSPNTHLVDGPPARAIGGLIDLYRIDLLVMGSIGRSGLDDILIGNTAEQVLNQIACSVLVVKPPGFGSLT